VPDLTTEHIHSILCDPATDEHPTGQIARALLAAREDLATARAEVERLQARVAELEAPGECQSLHKLRALLRRWLAYDDEDHASGQLCDDTRAALGLDRSNP